MSKSNHYARRLCCCICFVIVGLTRIMTIIASEPDYKHMLYGGVWKHVIFNPPDTMPDIVDASKHLIAFIKKLYPTLAVDKVAVTCLSQIELWYSYSDQSPLVKTEYVIAKTSETFPVSVPVSLGTTYNFLLNYTKSDSTQIVHHQVTITRTLQMEQFYIYAHSYHSAVGIVPGCSQKAYTNICAGCLTGLTVLSNFATNNTLELNPDQECHRSKDSHHDSCFTSVPTKSMSELEEISDDYSINLEHIVPSEKETRQKIRQLSVMTYNIWNFNTYEYNGRYHQRMNHISEVLKKAGPDIVSFQEVRLETPLGGRLGPCQIDHLISILPQYQFIYQPAQMQGNSLDQGRTEEGLAIFSKYPIISHDYLLLFRNQSNSADLNQRICLHAVISVPSFGEVHVFNTHFSLSHEAREAAVKQILDYMSCYDDQLIIFMGDLNAAPTETAIKMLTNGSGLLDTWDYLHPSSDGFTFSCLEDKLSKRIDYIFMRKTDSILVDNVKVLGDKTRSAAASDHRAVVATFVLRDKDMT